MITLCLPFPPSANTMYRNFRGRMILSKAGREYKAKVADIVAEAGARIEGRLAMFLALSSPTRRAYDIDNRCKQVGDSLQDAGVFDDDEQIDLLMVVRQPPGNGWCKVVLVSREDQDLKQMIEELQ